jgi:hypothetical protein
MNRFGRLSHSNAVGDDELAEATADSAAEDSLVELAADLLAQVKTVTLAEFTWQDAHYERDSRHGRELLFLMANYEWVRSTSEIVDIKRSGLIETTIKIDVDLSQITHEAFRKRTGPIWLPVAILPPYIRRDDPGAPLDADQGPGESDPFATMTDATGKQMPMMPAANLQHQISAAMAEIIAAMAVSYMPADSRQAVPIATRDQRLLLSAAIYRVLRQGSDEESQWFESVSAINSPRMTEARDKLVEMVAYFGGRLESLAGDRGARRPNATDDTLQAELARRAVKVLLALRESLIVVVLMDYDVAPSVLSVRVPPRRFTVSSASLFKPRTWIIRANGRLEIAVLLATAEADRQIQVTLPDGVWVDRRADCGADGRDGPWLDMTVHTPLPLQDLSAALDQVSAAQRHVQDESWPDGLERPFMDLVRVNAAEAVDILRHYQVTYGRYGCGDPPADAPGKDALIFALRRVATEPDWRGDQFLAGLETARGAFTTCKPSLSRHVKLNVNLATITGRVNIIEDVPQRAIPKRATISADVTVKDRDYFATARLSAFMSLILMLGVLGFLLGWHAVNPSASGPSPEVLAIVLTLFATTQALRGPLNMIGNGRTAAAVFPALTLAIALGFDARGATADYWAFGCVLAQVCLLLPMQNWTLLPAEWFGTRRILSTETPDYRHFEALHSDYWRDTTAEALMIGRKAYGYVVWQKADPESLEEAISPKLMPLLVWRGASPTESSSVLALLRTGTLRQAVTFIVFRGQPDQRWWPAENSGRNGHTADDRLESKSFDLAPGLLTPATGVSRMVDLFVGVSRDEILTIDAHPLSIAVRAAANKLTVLDAQLPVPAPVSGHDDKHWARIRLALRNSADIRRLTDFLDEIHATMQLPENARHVVAVQATPSAVPTVIAGPPGDERPAPDDGEHRLPSVLTSDLDFVNGATIDNEMPNARTWRVLAICADARSKIERDILVRLAAVRKRFQLGGLTYALLHGTAVMVLFVHESPGSQPEATLDSAAELEAALQREPGCDKLRVLLSRPLSHEDMEPVVEHAYPMLHIYFRWQDRPGATLNVLESISATLREALPAIGGQDWSISYALLQVLSGQVATARLTIRMHIPPHEIEGWTADHLEKAARNIESLAASAAARQAAEEARKAPDAPTDALYTQEEPVVRIDRIRKI